MEAHAFASRYRLRAVRQGAGDACNSGRCCVYCTMGASGGWYCRHPDAIGRKPLDGGRWGDDLYAVRISVDPGMDNICDGFVPLGPKEATP